MFGNAEDDGGFRLQFRRRAANAHPDRVPQVLADAGVPRQPPNCPTLMLEDRPDCEIHRVPLSVRSFRRTDTNISVDLPPVKRLPYHSSVSDEYPYAETPLARWLWERMAGRTLRQVARDSGVGAPLLSTYLHNQAVPSTRTIVRLARFFGVEPGEITRLIPDTRTDTDGAIPLAAVEQLIERAVDRALEARLAIDTVPQPTGVTEADRLVLFRGTVWEQLTAAERAGVLALVRRLGMRGDGDESGGSLRLRDP